MSFYKEQKNEFFNLAKKMKMEANKQTLGCIGPNCLLWNKPFQSIPLNHGCDFTEAAPPLIQPSLCVISTTKSLEIKSLKEIKTVRKEFNLFIQNKYYRC